MTITRRFGITLAALLAALAVVALAGSAEARSWAKWAPDPLGSDSSYGALSARPADSLTALQLAWVAAQKDWRLQRSSEVGDARTRSSITSPWSAHVARRTDERFARLASQPYESLADSERVWLVAESAAQIAVREAGMGQGNRGGGALVVGLLVGVVGGALAIGYAFSQAFQ